MTIRKLGMWSVIVGVTAAIVALAIDGAQISNDHSIVQHPGVLALSRPVGVLMFVALGLALLGAVVLALGSSLYARGDAPASGAQRALQITVPCVVVALVAGVTAGIAQTPLGNGTGTTKIVASATSARTPSTPPTKASVPTKTSTVLTGTATGNSPCEKALPTPASPGEVGTGAAGSSNAAEEHGPRGLVAQKPLTQAQRDALEVQMTEARAVAAKYPTVADANKAGYHISTVYVPCIGAHYTNLGLVGSFDPSHPAELLYDGTKPNSRIVGLSFLVFHPGGPPAGFAGPNDYWHQHNSNGGLCLQGAVVVGGEELTPDQCTKRGGHKVELTDLWMAHAWVVPGFECTWGVFSGECPELGGRVGGTAWDKPNPSANPG